MGRTIIEKIIGARSGREVTPGDIVDVFIDARVARDFGGANVVKNLKENGLKVEDPKRTFFTFDCNPGGSDQKYAENQHRCRMFAREQGIKVFDVDQGIGTHIAIDEGLVGPGEVLVSTDSHANILGAIGAFGQGMGDLDVAKAFSDGRVWFKVPPSLKITLKGMPGPEATPKDVALRLLKEFGANGLLGYSAEIYGEYAEGLDLSGRMTISSLCTEMGGLIILFTPDERIIKGLGKRAKNAARMNADPDAVYDRERTVDIEGLGPMVSRPGHPEDAVPLGDVEGTVIDSAFIGSCTNGRYVDMKAASEVLKGRKVAQGVVLKIVPSTRKVWERCLKEGIIRTFMDSGALVGNSGCAGCAEGQLGQNGPGEVTVSTGNRNFKGKQGKGAVYLASPATVAASAVVGCIVPAEKVLEGGQISRRTVKVEPVPTRPIASCVMPASSVDTVVRGRVWYIPRDNIDTDMIYHNRHLAITDSKLMGQYAFGNLEGYEDFSKKVLEGDIIVVGKNFGAGSSRQQAVDCFKALGMGLILAESFGSIYERNAINSGLPIMTYGQKDDMFHDGDIIDVDLSMGTIVNMTTDRKLKATPFSDVQMDIYRRGGLLRKVC
ncbi:MAG: aconitase/3-isopropylmalate dehydratase large subunit family protein [Candidatus Thermoplasmatota archaeon]|jgi:homoaconitate hydratase family protein/3-isopropylmalate dehydratase small subunit|nr:aconitase/3-isopropylmalate dehydratase large subunit family protein [Candidatus Thermoplasmatota archaeon]